MDCWVCLNDSVLNRKNIINRAMFMVEGTSICEGHARGIVVQNQSKQRKKPKNEGVKELKEDENKC